MDSNNLNILVEAKKEYMDQLCMIMGPLMIQTFMDIYSEAHKMSKGKKVLIQYQKLLKEVPNWNNHIVKEHSSKLCDSCSWFSDLLAAVFVSCVKILSSVRLNAENKKISIKLPSNEVFIHGCYVEAAKDIYKDPYIYHDDHTDYERNEELANRFRTCIEKTVKEMIPVQQILKTYISQGESMENKDLDFDNEEPEDSNDPDVNDEPEPEPDPEPEPEPESEPQPQPQPETETQPEPEETKNIEFGKKPGQPQAPPQPQAEEDEGVLFPGAPE